jgi:hypothetical protein
MFRRLQNILCCVVIAGFAAVCWYGKNNGEAVMTGGAVKTTMDKPVVVMVVWTEAVYPLTAHLKRG